MQRRRLSSSRGLLAAACACALGLVVGIGCSDPDPNYGPAGAIARYNPDLGGGSTTPAPSGDSGAGGKTPRQAFTDVYSTLKTAACPSCHAPPGANGAPPFFGADEETSYAAFKQKGYDKPEPAGSTNGLLTRGAHTGRALNDTEKGVVVAWRNAEAAAGGGGTPTPADAGAD